jgi:hypothetical protein
MKKIITLFTAFAVASAGVIQAQQMIVGWDFSQFAIDNFSSNDGASLTGDINGNYTGGAADFTGAASLGSFLYDGTLGSTTLGLNPADVEPQGVGDLGAAYGYMGTAGSRALLSSQGQANNSSRALGFNSGANGDSFVIAVTAGSAFDDWNFSFEAKNASDSDNSSSISWEYSTNGSSYTSAGVTSNISNSEALLSVDLSSVSALDGQSSVYFRGTLGGVNSGLTFVDNIAVNGTVVPEPSTYAAIFGAVALAVAAYRRRK